MISLMGLVMAGFGLGRTIPVVQDLSRVQGSLVSARRYAEPCLWTLCPNTQLMVLDSGASITITILSREQSDRLLTPGRHIEAYVWPQSDYQPRNGIFVNTYGISVAGTVVETPAEALRSEWRLLRLGFPAFGLVALGLAYGFFRWSQRVARG